jgi:hypothetical protein
MKRFLIGMGAVSVLSAAAAFAAVDLSNTELLKVQGKVEVKKGNMSAFKPVPANLKLAGALKRLDSGDAVKTREQSVAEMILKETCYLTVKEKALFEVPSVMGQAALSKLKAKQGSFLFKVISGSDFKVQTADVVAGVKGTMFEVETLDNLKHILTLPDLEIGIESGGGTNINVFEGEVELTHAQTGKQRRVKAGEGLAALGAGLLGLDKTLSEGFTPLRRFNPLEKIQERFGALGQALQGIPSSRLGLLGFNGGGLSTPLSIGRPLERVSRVFEGIETGLRNRMQGLTTLGGYRPLLERGQAFLQNMKGDPFKPEFDRSKYPVPTTEINVPENRIQEIHLGNGLFMSATPAEGCANVKLVPGENGWVLTEGEGFFRLRDFAGDLDGWVSVRAQDGRLVSQVVMHKGILTGRFTDSLESFKISPKNSLAIARNQTGKPEIIQAPSPGALPDEMAHYRFNVEPDLEAQRAVWSQKNSEKRIGALKDAGNQLGGPNGGKLGNVLDAIAPSSGSSGSANQLNQQPAKSNKPTQAVEELKKRIKMPRIKLF